jgi:tRNA (cmo5U34)-methyltransferase
VLNTTNKESAVSNRIAKHFWKASNGEALGTALASRPDLKALNDSEIQEILALLPPLECSHVLEVGAGTGRFTGLLAERAQSVMALDISEESLALNQDKHRDYPNIEYRAMDVVDYSPPAKSVDFVFVNWLFMYLDDDDSHTLLGTLAEALKPGGQIFVRESCDTPYNGKSWIANFIRSGWRVFLPGANTTYRLRKFKGSMWKNALWMLTHGAQVQAYRSEAEYRSLFTRHFDVTEGGHLVCYELAYQHQNQRYWLLSQSLKNCVGDGIQAAPNHWSFAGEVWRHFDSHIERSVPFFPQLHETIVRLAEQLVPAGGRVYELGCSTGNLCRKLERRLDDTIDVVGVDVEPNMIAAARNLGGSIRYHCADLRTYTLEPCHLAILCYCLQFIDPAERLALLSIVANTLEPGGAVIVAEKVKRRHARMNTLLQQAHCQYKLDQGFTSDEIEAKEKSLDGVMTPLYEDENPQLLTQAGLRDVHCIFRNLTFEAYIAFKN